MDEQQNVKLSEIKEEYEKRIQTWCTIAAEAQDSASKWRLLFVITVVISLTTIGLIAFFAAKP